MDAKAVDKAVNIGSSFSARALVIANARRMGTLNGMNTSNRPVDTTGDLAKGLLLLDVAAYHIASIYRHKYMIAHVNEGTANREAKKAMETIRNGICRFTSEAMNFFYPEHEHQFTSVANPWLTEGIKAARATSLLLPMAIQTLSSVAYRRKGSWEEKIIGEILPDLVTLANDLIRGLPGSKVSEGTFHAEKIDTFVAMYTDYVGPGVKANKMPIKPVDAIDPVVSQYLGSRLNTFKWQASHLKEETDTVHIKACEIVRFGTRAYIALKPLDLTPKYQIQSGDFKLI